MEMIADALLLIVVYNIPAIFAFALQSERAKLVFRVNLFTAWTLVGWFACLVWAFAKAKPTLTKEDADNKGFFARTWQTRSIAKKSLILIVSLALPVFAVTIYANRVTLEKERIERQSKIKTEHAERAAKNVRVAKEQAIASKLAHAKSSVKILAKNPKSVDFEMVYVSPYNPDAVCVVYRAANSFNAILPGVAVVINKREVLTDTAAFAKNCN
jgi:hypothetical protein